MKHKNIWLIGAGAMAVDYAKVLDHLEVQYLVIGNGVETAANFRSSTGQQVIEGGLVKFLSTKPELPDAVINAVSIVGLADVTKALLAFGVTEILLEKPGINYASEIDDLVEKAKDKQAKILLAYNRRFYASVLKAKEIIREDGGVSSFNFEFTEWSHVIGKLGGPPDKRVNWFLGNSTHIIDTAFYLGGKPKNICTFVKGKGDLDWHPVSSNYVGAGETDTGALFSYHANWQAPGRWAIEILTLQHRLIFKPIEKLQIQMIGSVAVESVEDIDYSLDEEYKPGLYMQCKAFIDGDYTEFCDLFEQAEAIEYYLKMSGYSNSQS